MIEDNRERSAVILAAGASTRMGRTKALVEWGSGTFLSSLLEVYLPFCAQVIVVVGADGARIAAAHAGYDGAEFVVNPAPERGQLSSLQCGLGALRAEARAVFFQPVDAPGISAQTLQALALALGGAPAVVPVHAGRHGHPVLLSRAVAGEILGLPPHATARDVLRAHRPSTVWVEVPDAAILRDLDDEAALREARQ